MFDFLFPPTGQDTGEPPAEPVISQEDDDVTGV